MSTLLYILHINSAMLHVANGNGNGTYDLLITYRKSYLPAILLAYK